LGLVHAARLLVLAVAASLLIAPAADARARLVAVTAPPEAHLADPSLKTYVFRFGPHRIGPYQVANGTDTVSPPPVSGSVVGMDSRLVTPDGVEIPQHEVMLHHIVFTNGGPDGERRDAACPHRPIDQRFYGTSEELRALTLPPGHGYRFTRDDRWRASWMVMNHQSRNRDALLEYRVTVDTDLLAPVVPYWIGVLPCRASPDPQYSVPGGGPPGSTHYRGRTWTLPVGGRIVAMGGHLHGGGRGLTVSQPECGGRPIYTARPTYATADDPLYAIKPLLHEPDPTHISWAQSATGWNAPAGHRLRVTAAYAAERPHMRVMGIAHVYVARGGGGIPCAPPPPDAVTLEAPFDGREQPPRVDLTLAALGRDGVARPIDRPPGRVVRRARNARVRVNRFAFSVPNLSIPRGGRITWRFNGDERHDATLASGPAGFSSPSSYRGDRWSQRFETPGEYRIHCSLHPVYMSQYVRVR
jgi:plastocyanin